MEADIAAGVASTPEGCDLAARHLVWRSEAQALQHALRSARDSHCAWRVAARSVGLVDLFEDEDEQEIDAAQKEDFVQRLQLVFDELLQGLEACELRLERLNVDLECLDDGAAEGLFGSPGRLKGELAELASVRQACAEVQSRSKGWVRCLVPAVRTKAGLEALADFLQEAINGKDELIQCCGEFAARRRAAVARAKAAIETAHAEERASSAGLLQDALSPQSRVDFPKITEICQRFADRPEEVETSAELLFSALSEEEAEAAGGPSRRVEVSRRKLKALTIAHELLYDDQVLSEFATRPLEPLKSLERLSPGSGLGTPAEEAIRMLAAEIRRRVEEKQRAEGQFFRPWRRAKTWNFGPLRRDGPAASPQAQPRLQSSKSAPPEGIGHSPTTAQDEVFSWQGDGAGPLRGRAGAEAFARRLRRWGSWHRWGSCEELFLLQDLHGTFQGMVATLARLHEELDCLDDGSTGLPLREQLCHMMTLLLAASDVQARALAWSEAVEMVVKGKRSLNEEDLAEFLEEAVAAGEELHRRSRGFTKLRKEAVERAKAFIEAGLPQLEAPNQPLIDWC